MRRRRRSHPEVGELRRDDRVPANAEENETVAEILAAMENEVLANIQTGGDSKLGTLSTSVKQFGSSGQSTVHSLIRDNAKKIAENNPTRRLTFPMMGNSKAAFLPRLLAMWAIVLPFLILRMVMLVVMFIFAMGPVYGVGFCAATGGPIVLQAYYRDAMEWAQEDDVFQAIWNTTAEIFAFVFNVMLFVLRLSLEIWNGLCPLLALLIDIIYDIIRQLAVMWYAAPVLQYIGMWLVRFVVYTIETFLDALVSVAEAFAQFAEDMTVNLTNAVIQEGEDQFEDLDVGRRRLFSVPGGVEVVGDVLLFICVSIATLIIRVTEALFVAFLPLIYSFLRMVLPKIIKYIPPIIQLGAKIVGVITSEPVKRIINYLIQAVPLIIEVWGAYVCAIVIYLGSAFCYLIYIICVTITFFLRYVIRPMLCSGNAILAGCFRAFVRSALNGQECYSCGGYHTACGCDPRNSVPTHGCDGDTCTDANGVAHPYTPPTPSPLIATRNQTRGTAESDEFIAFAADPNSLRDIATEYNAQQTDTTSVADIGGTSISYQHTSRAYTFETELESGGRCGVYDGTNPDCDPDANRSTTYGVSEPAAVRRRRSDISTVGTLPPGVAPPPQTPYTDAPTAAPTPRQTEVSSNRPLTSVSYDAVVTASAGFYAGLSQNSGTKDSAVVEWFQLGSMPYRFTDGQIHCLYGVDDNLPECSLSSARFELLDFQESVPKAVSGPASNWLFSDWGNDAWIKMRLAIPCNVSEVTATWMIDGSIVRGPASFVTRVTSVGGSFVETTTSSLPCGATIETQRTDSISIGYSAKAQSVTLSSITPCDPNAYRSPEHDAPLVLKRLTAFGPKTDYSDRRTTGVLPSDIVSFDALPRLSDVPIFLTVYPAHAVHVKMWDPCASQFAMQAVSGNPKHSTVFVVEDLRNATLDLHIAASHTDTDGFVELAQRPVDTLVVHFAPTTLINTSHVLLCSNTTCVSPLTATDTLTGYSQVHRQGLNYAWNEVFSNDSAIYGAAFWEPDYPYRHLSRGASMTFDGLIAAGVGGLGDFTLRFHTDAFTHLRETTWATVRLETNLLPEFDTSSQWVYDVDNRLQSNGVTSSPPNERCFPERVTHTYFQPNLTHIASFRDPFNGMSTTRRWFGITEINAFGRAGIDPQTGRRLLADTDITTEDKAAFTDLQERSSYRQRKLVQAETPTTTQDRMRKVGLDAFKHKTTHHDTVDGHRVHTAHTSAAPDHALANPFAPDLNDLPETEPVFSCAKVDTGNMECRQQSRPTLGFHNQSTAARGHPTNAARHTDRSNTQVSHSRSEIQRLFDAGANAMSFDTDQSIDRIIARKNARAVWQNQQRPPVRHSRMLMGRGIAALVGAMIDLFEDGVCAMMGCSAYCPGADCSSDSDLGECFKGFGAWIVRNLFGCGQDESIDDCVVDKLLSGVLSLLDQMLDWILQIVDAFGNGIAQMLHIGDILKIIACESCAVTNIAVGVLVDFTESFSLSACNDIVDIGTDQCDNFGMGDIAEIGEKVFSGYFGMLKILFGLFQVIPALIEVQIELAIFVGQQILELFPELIGDAMDILLWFIASSDVIYTLETLFEAFDDIVTEIEQKQEIFAPSGGAPGPPPFSFSDVTTNAASTKNNQSHTDPVFVEPSEAGGPCVDSAATDNDASCDQSTTATGDFFDSSASRSAVVAQTNADQPASKSALSYNLGGCGCKVSRQPCEDGPGAGNCPFNTGVAALRQQAKTDAAIQQTSQQDPTDTSSWPHCSDVSERVVLPAGAEGGTEMERRYVQSRRCYVVSRKTLSGGVNDMAIATAKDTASGSSSPSWWPFKKFSKQDGTLTSDNDTDINLGEFDGSSTPSNSEIHRRRRTLTDRRLLNTARARALMGVNEFYHDDQFDYSKEETRAMAAQAAVDMARMLTEANTTYAEYQIALLRDDAAKLLQFGSTTWESLKQVEYQRMSKAAHATLGAARRLLAGFSGATTSDVLCGVSFGATGSGGSPIHPNTYPCCKGLWCCLRPPIPRSWRFKKEWIAWHDSWTRDTQCPELRTHPDGWLFAIRAASKVGKTVSALLVPVWPYSALVEWVWSFTNFPDDEWPQEKNHGFPKWVWHQFVCVGLNAGIYIAFALGVLVIAISSPMWISFVVAHQTLYNDIFAPTTLQTITVSRKSRRPKQAQTRSAAGVHDTLWRDGRVLSLHLPARTDNRQEVESLLL